MEASWHQNRLEINANFERPFFEKSLFFRMKNNDFEGSRVCKIDGKSIRNPSKIEAQDGMPLGIDSGRIFVGFGKQVGRENRAKIDQKSIKKTI